MQSTMVHRGQDPHAFRNDWNQSTSHHPPEQLHPIQMAATSSRRPRTIQSLATSVVTLTPEARENHRPMRKPQTADHHSQLGSPDVQVIHSNTVLERGRGATLEDGHRKQQQQSQRMGARNDDVTTTTVTQKDSQGTTSTTVVHPTRCSGGQGQGSDQQGLQPAERTGFTTPERSARPPNRKHIETSVVPYKKPRYDLEAAERNRNQNNNLVGRLLVYFIMDVCVKLMC